MGHLFRACNLAAALQSAGHSCRIYINAHPPALARLAAMGLAHGVVDLEDQQNNDWEGRLIARDGIRVWIDDRHDTGADHALRVKRQGIRLVTFDDRGSGAAHADLNIAALAFDSGEQLPGRRVLRGVDYLILNPEILRYRRARTEARRLVVTLGGSDTYGVSVKVVRGLRAAGRTATIIVGPSFAHDRELSAAVGPEFVVKRSVPSLAAELAQYDLAITGGGITPFEANAAGLPCLVIANEPFEIPVGRQLERLGGCIFAGHHLEWDEAVLRRDLPIEAMSRAGLARIGLEGAARVVRELIAI